MHLPNRTDLDRIIEQRQLEQNYLPMKDSSNEQNKVPLKNVVYLFVPSTLYSLDPRIRFILFHPVRRLYLSLSRLSRSLSRRLLVFFQIFNGLHPTCRHP